MMTKDRFMTWAETYAQKPAATWWLAAVAFAESSFFILPPDLVLIAILATASGRWLFYSTVTTLSSVAGGIAGYGIGLIFFETVGQAIVNWYHLENAFASVGAVFSSAAFTAIFLAAFTPIPYKVFTIAAGLFRVNLLVFITASLLGRGIRFYIEGYLMHRFGRNIVSVVYRRLNTVSLLVGALLIIALVIWWQ